MKKILVTGATGFVGSNLVRRFLNYNYQVHIIKRKNSNIWRIKDIISKLHVHEVDLAEKKRLFRTVKTIKPNVIFHLANLGLYSGVDPSLEESIKGNLLGTVNLIDSTDAIDYECFINTGSSSEYGIKKKAMKETDLCEPQTNYALTKLTATLYAQAYARRTKKPLVIIRLFSPFGHYDHPARLITETILKMLKGDKVLIRNPSDVRDYIFVEDVLDAYFLCMRNSHRLSGEIFNISMGKQTYIKDVVKMLATEIGSKSQIEWANARKKDNNLIVWQADILKIKEQLGWYPKIALDQGLKKTISWFKKYAYLYG